MTRLGLVPELTFAEDFRQLRRDIEEIKKAQRIGRDILKPKIIEALDGGGNPTAWDVQTQLNQSGDGQRADFTAIFTADHQKEPFAVPLFELYYGAPGTQPPAGSAFGNSYISFTNLQDGRIAYRGSFGTNNYMDVTKMYLKVYMFATDTGTLEVLPVWQD